MIKVIINADDCGNTPEVNAAIDEALSKGVISSTTIMANSKYLDVVHNMVERYPEASFGIHLNLTEGPSFTKSEVFRKYGIIDKEGCFIHGNTKRCSNPNEELKGAIKDEWDAQMNHLINIEHFKLSHVDGHHHCHALEGLEDVLVELMHKYGLTKARNRYHIPPVGIREKILGMASEFFYTIGIRRIPGIKLRIKLLNAFVNYNKTLLEGGIKRPEYFESYDIVATMKILASLEDNSTIELMCHPGLTDYKNEYDRVIINDLKINCHNTKMISYNEL